MIRLSSNFFLFGALLTLLGSPSAFSDELKEPAHTETIEHRFNLFAVPSAVLLIHSEEILSAIDASVGFNYAFTDRLAVSITVHQGLKLPLFSILYTELTAGISYAFMGSQIRRSKKVSLQGVNVATAGEYGSSGLFGKVAVAQYFFNGSTSVVPLTGPSVSLFYQFPSPRSLQFRVGGSVEFVANENLFVLPIRASFGIHYVF